MEHLVMIVEVGAYSERQYQRQDGKAEYFKSRGLVMKHGGDATRECSLHYRYTGFIKP